MRRVRGAIGMGLVWASAWFGAGMAMAIGLFVMTGTIGADVPYPLFFGLLGFLGGVTFSGVLRLVEGRRRFDELSLPRFAGWGGAGGAMLAVGLTAVTGIVEVMPLLAVVFGLSGAICAGGSLVLARKAEGVAGLDSGVDLDEVGLTEAERRELLGP